MARHKEHAQVSGSRLALIRGLAGPDGPGGPLDPMTAALDLATRARTDRERLKAAESVRAATSLAIRAMRGGALDAEMLDRLDGLVVRAANLFREVGGFENALRAAQGHREAIRLRLEAVRILDAIETALVVALSGGEPLAEPVPVTMSPEHYWASVPERYRDASRFAIHRVVQLVFGSTRPGEKVKVFEGDVLVWAQETPASTPRLPIWKEEP